MNRSVKGFETMTIKDFDEPNPQHRNNYMLDTSAYNKIAENEDLFKTLKQSLKFGVRYYRTSIQDKELQGVGAKVYDKDGMISERYNITDEFKNKMKIFEKINLELDVKRVSNLASLMLNHWILDGTDRVAETNSETTKLHDEICCEKPELRKKYPYAQRYDAMIAEAAMYHNCYLVSNDKRLRKTVNQKFPGKSIDVLELE